MPRVKLSGFNPQKIIHPKDAAVLNKVNRIPLFKPFLENTVNRYISVVTTVASMGEGFSITSTSAPALYEQMKEDCRILGKEKIPDLTTMFAYRISSNSTGLENDSRILLSTGSLELLSKGELDFLIGHELGHIMAGHKPYQTFVEAMCDPMFHLDGLILDLVKLPLLEWYRICHYTADRVGLLCCQDINLALSAMIKMSGLPMKYYSKIDIEGFKMQARAFSEEHGGAMDSVMKAFIVSYAKSPWMVKRVKELLEWYESEEYRNLLNTGNFTGIRY